MAGLASRRDRPDGLGGVRSGDAPSGSIVDPVAERRRDAMLLLRRNKIAASAVVSYQLDAILFLNQAGRPQTAFVRQVDGDLDVSPPFEGFVI